MAIRRVEDRDKDKFPAVERERDARRAEPSRESERNRADVGIDATVEISNAARERLSALIAAQKARAQVFAERKQDPVTNAGPPQPRESPPHREADMSSEREAARRTDDARAARSVDAERVRDRNPPPEPPERRRE